MISDRLGHRLHFAQQYISRIVFGSPLWSIISGKQTESVLMEISKTWTRWKYCPHCGITTILFTQKEAFFKTRIQRLWRCGPQAGFNKTIFFLYLNYQPTLQDRLMPHIIISRGARNSENLLRFLSDSLLSIKGLRRVYYDYLSREGSGENKTSCKKVM